MSHRFENLGSRGFDWLRNHNAWADIAASTWTPRRTLDDASAHDGDWIKKAVEDAIKKIRDEHNEKHKEDPDNKDRDPKDEDDEEAARRRDLRKRLAILRAAGLPLGGWDRDEVFSKLAQIRRIADQENARTAAGGAPLVPDSSMPRYSDGGSYAPSYSDGGGYAPSYSDGGGGGYAPSYSDGGGGSGGYAPSYSDGGSYAPSYSDGGGSYGGGGDASYSQGVYDSSIIYNGPPLRYGSPDEFFFTQFWHPVWNPYGPPRSSDCGPASLAMIALAMGKFRPSQNRDPMIVAARQLMGADPNRSVGTNDGQIIQGAQALGLRTQNLAGQGPEAMINVLRNGGMLVVSGNPISYERELGFNNGTNELYADSGNYDGGHFIAVVGFNEATGNFIVNDPAAKIGSIELTPRQMVNYQNGEGGGGVVALYP